MTRTKEERLVLNQFKSNFKKEINLFRNILSTLQIILESSKTSTKDYNRNSVLVLAGLNYKGFTGSFDRISKGYISDSEAILKKTIESFLAQGYLFLNPAKAKKWYKGEMELKSLESNRLVLSKKLDILNNREKFFPTDKKDFFEGYVYRNFYKNSNEIAHLNSKLVLREMRFDRDGMIYDNTMVLGPKWDLEFTKIIINRIIMFSMFQASLLATLFKVQNKEYERTFRKIYKYFEDKTSL